MLIHSETTIKTTSSSLGEALSHILRGGSSKSGSSSRSQSEAQRKLILPDELMRFKPSEQLLIVENGNPIAARKIVWYSDERFRPHGVNLRPAPAAAVDMSYIAPGEPLASAAPQSAKAA